MASYYLIGPGGNKPYTAACFYDGKDILKGWGYGSVDDIDNPGQPDPSSLQYFQNGGLMSGIVPIGSQSDRFAVCEINEDCSLDVLNRLEKLTYIK